MNRALRLVPLALALVALTAAPPSRAADPTYQESLDVRELEVTVGLPDLAKSRLGKLDSKAFQVLDDGIACAVTRAVPVGPSGGQGPGPWSVIVYVDRALARRDTVARSLGALAGRAQDLVRLGRVEIVVADPIPIVALTASGDPEAIATTLAEVARRAAPTAAGEGDPAEAPTLDRVRNQTARLLTALAGRDPAGPRVLLVVADASEAQLTESGRGQLPANLLQQFPEAGQALASFGWSVVTVAIAPEPPLPTAPGKPAPVDDFDRFRETAQGNQREVTFAIGKGDAGKADFDLDRAVANAFEPRGALVRALARESGGGVVQSVVALERTLAELGQRWQLVYRAPGKPDGRLRPVEVRLLPEDTRLTSPRWRRSGTPEQVGRARGIDLLAGGGAAMANLPAKIDLVSGLTGRPVIRVQLAAPTTGQPSLVGPLRVTLVFDAGGGEPVAQVEMPYEGQLVAGGEPYELPLVIDATVQRVAAVVEDLATGAWSGQAFALVKDPR
jgi:hypothetical protein